MPIQNLLSDLGQPPTHQKRVVVFCHNLEINGANNFIYTLLLGLKSTHSFTVYSPKAGAFSERLKAQGVETNIISITDHRISEIIRNYDLVIANTLMMAPVILESARQNISHILVVHETWKPINIDYYLKDLWCIEGLSSADVIACLEKAHKVVFPANYLAKIYEGIVEPHRRSTIYCTIDFEAIDCFRSSNSREDVRFLVGVEPDELLLLQVGTVTRRKAQFNTLRAFHAFVRRFPDIKAKLHFVGARSFRPGEREYIEEIRQYVREHELEHRVTVFEVRSDIFAFFMAADILVHPSVNEVLPLAILEAAAFGLPVIASNLDGIPEALRHHQEAWLINPFEPADLENAIAVLARDKPLRQKLAASAFQRVRNQHSPDVFVEMYSELINYTLHR